MLISFNDHLQKMVHNLVNSDSYHRHELHELILFLMTLNQTFETSIGSTMDLYSYHGSSWATFLVEGRGGTSAGIRGPLEFWGQLGLLAG